MTRLKIKVFLLLLGVAATAYAGAIRDGSLNAKSNASGVYVWWYSNDETSVARFEVWRSSGSNTSFVKIGQKALLGNGEFYDFQDDTAFKLTDNYYQYRVRIVYADGSVVDTPPVGVIHSVSSVRRTWGSIKAMFR
jgi:hypothetical protein